MKIVQFTQPGPPEVLKYIDAPVPEPKAGEVLVRARSIGVGCPTRRSAPAHTCGCRACRVSRARKWVG
jgi:hypothetical protein